VVPHVHVPVLSYWRHLHMHLPDLVHVRPSAYDWHGVRIQNCSSVWIREHQDVQLYDKPHLYHEVISYQEGTHRFVQWMQSNKPNVENNITWQEITEALHLIHTHVSDREARMRRNKFGVIHGKKTTSHKRARSNLDLE
jgi:hypothetical protein